MNTRYLTPAALRYACGAPLSWVRMIEDTVTTTAREAAELCRLHWQVSRPSLPAYARVATDRTDRARNPATPRDYR